MHLVFDIGATNTRLALARSGRLVRPIQFLTPVNFRIALDRFSGYVGAQKLSGIAGCLPGHPHPSTGKLGKLRNLPGWSRADLNVEFKKYFQCPIYVKNDVELAALGEANYGAGKGRGIVAYVTVSTGVNGARVVEGKLDRRAWGWSLGRQIVSANGDLESYVSGAGLQRRFGRPAESIKNASIWRQVHKTLARGLYNTVLHWSPEVLVLGGGMVRAGAIKIPQVRAELFSLKRKMKANVFLPALVKATLGSFSGLYGAMEYLRREQ